MQELINSLNKQLMNQNENFHGDLKGEMNRLNS